MRVSLLSVIAVAACASGGNDQPDAPAGSDAPGTDAPGMDGMDPGAKPAPLLLTEIVLTPSGGEFIEIANPTDEPAPLAGFHLTDAGAYFRISGGAVTVDDADFIAAFPDGAVLPPRSAIAIALGSAAGFQTIYGAAPAFSIADGTMRSVASTGVASLTNTGEPVVLFHWDGRTDLVGDADIMLAGVPSATNGLVNKSAVPIDGPDGDASASVYATDALTLVAQTATPGTNLSTKRIVVESGHETQGGAGNGISGDDETTEDTRVTWDSGAPGAPPPAIPFTMPTPGALPTGLFP